MERSATTVSVRELLEMFPALEFPEYQREPDVWTRDQKQRLIDSILRHFDISTVYFYCRSDEVLECIDGRQRINAIVSFLGENLADQRDDGFPLRFHNEVYGHDEAEFGALGGKTFAQLQELSECVGHDDEPPLAQLAARACEFLLDYRVSTIYLGAVERPEEFNLQFLRLNLGTLINSGEKLHAMVGRMRDLVFESPRIGRHPFFQHVSIPTRRYAPQQVAAQALIQIFYRTHYQEFTRARHIDLQRFLKENAAVEDDDEAIVQMEDTLDALERRIGAIAASLRNRAITVTVVVFAWSRHLSADGELLEQYGEFVPVFIARLREQVDAMRRLAPNRRYQYLIDFQRHVTQASVEKPAVEQRHAIIEHQFDYWVEHGRLEGDLEG